MTSTLLHYIVELEDGSRFDVRIDPNDPKSLTVDGVGQELGVEASQSGVTVSTADGQRVPLQLFYEHGELVALAANGERRRVRVHLADTHEFRSKVLSQPPPPAVEHSGRIAAPIAGNIVSLCAKEGSELGKGDALIVLEAMKMQNTIPSPVAGTVSYAVKVGQTVRRGDLLATIVASGSK
ncbi:MAG TPA: biotin/lipoyl-containing protein [Polyangiaceae bacterium]|nr:biotin/lipoyl-containing protein [Polyangiaceae bacterium]